MRTRGFKTAAVAVAVVLLLGAILASCGGSEPEAADDVEETTREASGGEQTGTEEAGDAEQTGTEEAGAEQDETDQAADADQQTDAVVESGFESLEHQGYRLRWRVDGEMLDVVLSYQTEGWLAIGFDPSSMMQDANIIIGYVENGELTISDQYGTGQTAHAADTEIDGSDDIAEASGSESDGSTELRFSIPLDSGDSADRPLTEGETYTVLLAHGPNDSDDMSTYHQGRTSVEIEI